MLPHLEQLDGSPLRLVHTPPQLVSSDAQPSFVGVGCAGGGGLVGGGAAVGELAGGGLLVGGGVAVDPLGGDEPVDVPAGGGAVGLVVGAAVFWPGGGVLEPPTPMGVPVARASRGPELPDAFTSVGETQIPCPEHT